MKYKVTLNGTVYEVEVEKGEAILLDEYKAVAPQAAPAQAAPVQAAVPAQPAAAAAAAPAAPQASADAVKSPLPGTILAVKANPGQAVKAGDIIVVIEAMKMENEVLAPKDGTVSKVYVTKGAQVETGAALFELA